MSMLDIMYYVGDKVINDESHLDDNNVLVPEGTEGRVIKTITNSNLSLSVVCVWYVDSYPFTAQTERPTALIKPKSKSFQ